MCVIEFLENCQPGEIKYSSPDDLLRLLSYMYRSDKTFSDSVRKKNTAYDGPYCGCEPFFFPKEYETDPDMVYEVMMFTIGAFPRSHAVSLVKHRIVSFHASTGLLPQDLDTLGRQIAQFYANRGHIAAYAVHADTYQTHIHVAVCNVSYLTGNQLRISYEYNILSAMCNEYEDRLMDDPGFRENRERILFGEPCYTANIGLTAREQIRANGKGQIGQ